MSNQNAKIKIKILNLMKSGGAKFCKAMIRQQLRPDL